MLRDGTLPDGYTVKKRRLVQVGAAATVLPAKSIKKKKRKKDKREKARPLAA
jgi:hypothetical protein